VLTALEPRKLLPKLSERLFPVFMSDIPMAFPVFLLKLPFPALGAGRTGLLPLVADGAAGDGGDLPAPPAPPPLPPAKTLVVPPPPTKPVELKMEESPLMDTPPIVP